MNAATYSRRARSQGFGIIGSASQPHSIPNRGMTGTVPSARACVCNVMLRHHRIAMCAVSHEVATLLQLPGASAVSVGYGKVAKRDTSLFSRIGYVSPLAFKLTGTKTAIADNHLPYPAMALLQTRTLSSISLYLAHPTSSLPA